MVIASDTVTIETVHGLRQDISLSQIGDRWASRLAPIDATPDRFPRTGAIRGQVSGAQQSPQSKPPQSKQPESQAPESQSVGSQLP